MSWRSLLDGELKVRALEVVAEIVEVFADAADAGGPPADGGLEGAGGQACLLAYAGQVRDDESMIARGAALLDGMVGALGEQPRAPGLWGGLADARFLVAHLAGGEEAEEALAVMDDAIGRAVAPPADGGVHIDLIGGLAGIGIAALEGGAGGEALATRVLAELEARATADAGGTAWFTPAESLPPWQRELCPEGYWNLGLAHGIPGVIAFLAALVDTGVEAERARTLLRGAVPWLLAAAPPRAPARFMSWRGVGAPTEPTRLAWCYGDPGVTVAVLAAARAVGDGDWEREACTMARGMATRSFDDSGVLDMGICHGAAGVAHIFNRLYQATGDEVLAEAARGWLARLFDMRRPGEAVAGFPARNVVESDAVWVADGGVLMGAAGVGLVLLAAASAIEPGWDRTLACGLAPLADAEPA